MCVAVRLALKEPAGGGAALDVCCFSVGAWGGLDDMVVGAAQC